MANSQGQGFGPGTLSVSSQSLCLCKNSSEPFTPRLLPAVRIKIHTHSLGTGPGPGPALSRDKEIEADKRLDYKPSMLCYNIFSCLILIQIGESRVHPGLKQLVLLQQMNKSRSTVE